jgi:cell division protein FtsI (penicillin-binding protein 3)
LYEADHGCVVVMETKTGHVKAISNLGRAMMERIETTNYAVAESHEPGSISGGSNGAFEDRADTSTVSIVKVEK